jgi:lipoprotein signal peptidase
MRDEIVVSTTIMHVVFVTLFFAGPGSWSYYSYVLVIGAAVCCAVDRFAVAWTWVLLALAASGQTGTR